MIQILVDQKYSPQSKAQLKAFDGVNVNEFSSHEEFEKYFSDTNILLIRSKTPIYKNLLEKNKNLNLIITATSGFDHIDLKACSDKNIIVAHTPHANAQSAAELTFSLMLELHKNLIKATSYIKNNQWRSPSLMGHELYQKNLGIVGFGRIGSLVSQMANAFGMNVFAYDPYVPDEAFTKLQVQRMGYMEILRHVDVISFHVPLTSETFEMVNAKTLSEVSPNLFLINASRGKIIREPDLIYFLKSKRIKGAALDVFHTEPLSPQSELHCLKNVIMTPHMGAYTHEAQARSSLEAIHWVSHFLKNEQIQTVLPPRTKWAEKLL